MQFQEKKKLLELIKKKKNYILQIKFYRKGKIHGKIIIQISSITLLEEFIKLNIDMDTTKYETY